MRGPSGDREPLPGLLGAFAAYLALENRPISREHLRQLFWPGVERGKALHSLRQTLSRIRKAAGTHAIEGGDPIRWSPDLLEVDVHALEEAIAEERAADALELVRGPFLQGFRRPDAWELEDWIDRTRGRIASSVVRLVTGAASRADTAGDAERALDLVSRARRLFPREDRLAVLEVELLAETGSTAEAAGAAAALDPEMPEELRRRAEQAVGAGEEPDRPGRSTPDQPATPRPTASAPARPSFWSRPKLRTAVGLLASLMVVFTLLAVSVGEPQVELGTLRPAMGPQPWPGGSDLELALLFCSDRATQGTSRQLFRTSLEGLQKHRITTDWACSAWAQPDGSLLAMVRVDSVSPETRLARYRRDPDNPLAEWSREWIDTVPKTRGLVVGRNLADDGSLVFPARDEAGQWDLYRIFAQGDSVLRLTNDPEVEMSPAIDPRAGSGPVVYTRYERTGPDEEAIRKGPADLYAVPREGGVPVRITSHPAVDNYPAIRGDSLVFVRWKGVGAEDGLMELFLLDLETGSEERLTRNFWNDYIPRWSPDRRKICWQSEEYGHYEMNIRVMDLQTRKERVLVSDPGRDSGCSWTPDGRAVVYQAYGDGEPDVRLAVLDEDSTRALTRLDSYDYPVRSFIRVPTLSALSRRTFEPEHARQ
ncbi:MAG: hypothetical protein ACN0LA_06355 [Candidatus Longimicrobiales bacterium M2_2A_002]